MYNVTQINRPTIFSWLFDLFFKPCKRCSIVETKEAVRIGYNGLLFQHEYVIEKVKLKLNVNAIIYNNIKVT